MISRIIKVEVGVILITLTEKSVSGVGAGFKLKSGQSETFHEEFACLAGFTLNGTATIKYK